MDQKFIFAGIDIYSMGWLSCLQSFGPALQSIDLYSIFFVSMKYQTAQHLTRDYLIVKEMQEWAHDHGIHLNAVIHFKVIFFINYLSSYIDLKEVTYLYELVGRNSGKSWCFEFEIHSAGHGARNSQNSYVAVLKQNFTFNFSLSYHILV